MTNDQMLFINDQLRYAGFSVYPPEELLSYGDLPSFELQQIRKFGSDEVQATLYIKQSAQSELYFLNRHELTHGKHKQIFRMRLGKGITFKEGYNLLCGRAVYKKQFTEQNQEYYCWMYLNFSLQARDGYQLKKLEENIAFDLNLAVTGLKLTADNWERAMLVKALQRGQLQPVKLENGKALIAADPENKQIIVTMVSDTEEPGETESQQTAKARKRIPVNK